jgi:hypothetical protein
MVYASNFSCINNRLGFLMIMLIQFEINFSGLGDCIVVAMGKTILYSNLFHMSLKIKKHCPNLSKTRYIQNYIDL